jgi:hypothetical protein
VTGTITPQPKSIVCLESVDQPPVFDTRLYLLVKTPLLKWTSYHQSLSFHQLQEEDLVSLLSQLL